MISFAAMGTGPENGAGTWVFEVAETMVEEDATA